MKYIMTKSVLSQECTVSLSLTSVLTRFTGIHWISKLKEKKQLNGYRKKYLIKFNIHS